MSRTIGWPGWSTAAGRAITIVPVLLLSLWVVTTITASAALSRISPELAIGLDRDNARALERAASQDAAQLDPVSARRAIASATRSLIASPLSGEGAAALGNARAILSSGADPSPLFRYSQFLSRRVIATQIWAIQYHVGQGDVPGALREYDRLFRTSDFDRARFMPVLLAASASRPVTEGMARLLAVRPPWLGDYYSGLLATFPGAENFATLVRAMRFDPADPEGATRLGLALARLVDAGRPDLAFTLYRGARRSRSPALVRDGDFNEAPVLPPFDWQLTQNDALLADLGTNDAGRPVLQLVNRGGQPGALARQLLLLRPGTYRLSFAVGAVAGNAADRPRMLLRCLAGDRELLVVPFPTASDVGRRVAADVTVPTQGCAAQWLIVQAGNPVDGAPGQQWLGGVRVDPAAPRAPAG